jgi:ketosteroid isomerase-like protein
MRLTLTALSLNLTLAAAPALAAPPVFNAPKDVAAITALEKFNAISLNTSAVVANYAPGAVVYDIMLPGVYQGRAQITAGFAPQLQAIKTLATTFPSMDVFSDGTMACAATQLHFSVVLKSGTSLHASVRELDILQKTGGRWQVSLQHFSYIADPKTGKMILDWKMTPAPALQWSASPFTGSPAPASTRAASIRAWTMQFATVGTVPDFLNLLGPGDNELVFDTFAQAPLHGQAALTAAYGPGLAQVTSASASLPQFFELSDGWIGAQQDTQILTLKMKNGSTAHWTVRQSDCLHYANGKWYSVFDELSFPLDLKTGQAAMSGY